MAVTRPRTRIYLKQNLSKGQKIAFDRQQSAYLTRVLHLKPGAEIGVFNAREGEWRAHISIAGPREAWAVVGDHLCPPEVCSGVSLAFAPLKKGPLEWLLVKAVELGVSSLQPVISDYTQVTLTRPERLQTLLQEATEQCERCCIPELRSAQGLGPWLATAGPVVVALERGQGVDARAWLADGQGVPPNVLVGPEGGFSEMEADLLAQRHDTTRLNLGPRILKAETAALSLLTLAQTKAGEFTARPAFRS